MVKYNQIVPSFFDIDTDFQEEIIYRIMYNYNYDDKIIKILWEETRDDYIKKLLKKYSKDFKNMENKKKKEKTTQFFEKQINNDLIQLSSKEREQLTKKDDLKITSADDYSTFRIMVDCFLPHQQERIRWAINPDKLSFATSINNVKNNYENLSDKDEELRKKRAIGNISIYNEKLKISSRSGLLEDGGLSKTDTQCLASCGKKPKKNAGIKCYICGEPINVDNGVSADGSQCEHVVPVASMAALCGLYGGDYEETIDNYFHNLAGDINGTVFHDNTNISRDLLNKWRKLLLGFIDGSVHDSEGIENGGGKSTSGVLYRWAHPGCNMIKTHKAFLALDWTAPKDKDEWDTMIREGFPKLDSKKYYDEDEVRFVLSALVNLDDQNHGKSNSSNWRKKFPKYNFKKNEKQKKKEFVDRRLKTISNKTLYWAKCILLSEDIITNKFKLNDEFKLPNFDEDKWKRLRSILCSLCMDILDFRIEEKLKKHYSKLTGKKIDDWDKIIGGWRKEEWIELVGDDIEPIQSGGKRIKRRKMKGGVKTAKKAKSVKKANKELAVQKTNKKKQNPKEKTNKKLKTKKKKKIKKKNFNRLQFPKVGFKQPKTDEIDIISVLCDVFLIDMDSSFFFE